MASEFLTKLFKEQYIVQNINELDWLVDKVSKANPVTILEIGVEKGGTLKVWEQMLPQNKGSILIGVDINPNIQWYTDGSNVTVHILKGDSRDKSTLDEILKILDGRELDFIYMDADLTVEDTENSFKTFVKLVRSGGLIGFHDINSIRQFFNGLPNDKTERFYKRPPYEPCGFQMTIGTGIYRV